MDIKLSLNWNIDNAETTLEVDPLLFKLLNRIQEKGSLSQAVKDANVSYRFAWGLLTKWEQHIGSPFVLKKRGQGASLTLLGKKLLQSQQQLNEHFTPELNKFSASFKHDFESILLADRQPSLRVFASHGLAVGVLRDLVAQSSNFKLDLHFQGSIEGLRSLKNQSCEVAGFHIPVGELGRKLSHHYLPWINRATHKLVYVVKRNQGLMVKKDNPKKIESLQSLLTPDTRFINRQNNSGTRLLFDQLLKHEGINNQLINGYQNEEFTHMAVGAMVASGAVDACFGISPIADTFELTFIPQVWEHYCLAVPNSIADDDRIHEMITLLKSTSFKQELNKFTGYDTSRSGSIVEFADIFAN